MRPSPPRSAASAEVVEPFAFRGLDPGGTHPGRKEVVDRASAPDRDRPVEPTRRRKGDDPVEDGARELRDPRLVTVRKRVNRLTIASSSPEPRQSRSDTRRDELAKLGSEAPKPRSDPRGRPA